MSGDAKQTSSSGQYQGAAQPMHSQYPVGQQLSRQCSLLVTNSSLPEHQPSHQASPPIFYAPPMQQSGLPVSDLSDGLQGRQQEKQYCLPFTRAPALVSQLSMQNNCPVPDGQLSGQQPSHQERVPINSVPLFLPSHAASLLARPTSDPVEVNDSMQLLCGYTVSSRHPAEAIPVRPEAIQSLGSMPLGTILLPANHSLPPGSVLLPMQIKPGSQQHLLHAGGSLNTDCRPEQGLEKAVAVAPSPRNQADMAREDDRQLSTCSLGSQPVAQSAVSDQAMHKHLVRAESNIASESLQCERQCDSLGLRSELADRAASEGPSVQGLCLQYLVVEVARLCFCQHLQCQHAVLHLHGNLTVIQAVANVSAMLLAVICAVFMTRHTSNNQHCRSSVPLSR